MGNASAAFGKLPDRLWKGQHVSIEVNYKVNQAVVFSFLLHGAETWAIYMGQVKKFHAHMMAPLRVIMNVPWKDKITNVDFSALQD